MVNWRPPKMFPSKTVLSDPWWTGSTAGGWLGNPPSGSTDMCFFPRLVQHLCSLSSDKWLNWLIYSIQWLFFFFLWLNSHPGFLGSFQKLETLWLETVVYLWHHPDCRNPFQKLKKQDPTKREDSHNLVAPKNHSFIAPTYHTPIAALDLRVGELHTSISLWIFLQTTIMVDLHYPPLQIHDSKPKNHSVTLHFYYKPPFYGNPPFSLMVGPTYSTISWA